MVDFKKIGERAAAEGKSDMTKQVSGEGGGEYTPPAEGPCRVRFIGYIEIGQHTSNFKGQEKKAYQAVAQFEISGPKHPPQDFDGKLVPHVAEIKMNVSRHEKATMVKLFNILNWKGAQNNFLALLGEGYLATIRHRKYKRRDGTDGVAVELTDDNGVLTIRPPSFPDPETGEPRTVQVAEAISPLRGFMWDFADKDCWDTLFIDGTYEAREAKDGKPAMPARSKNKWQNLIKSSNTFKGSAIHELLGGGVIDVPDAERPDHDEEEAQEDTKSAAGASNAGQQVPTGQAADDALAGVV
jgi:hypothetical protein